MEETTHHFIECPLDCSTPNGDGCDVVDQCKQECSPKYVICYTHTLNCKCDTQTKGLSSVEPISKEGGTTTIASYFGVTTSLLSIKIEDSQCTNIQRESDSKLKCDIGQVKKPIT
ncbi:hypothetical protein ACTFIV_010006 [Dictyostelium citrinum]